MAEEYVKGRLPQESNPTPGRYPGFVASHDTTGNEDYRPTSPDNPLPTSNYIQRESGVWVPISKDNPMPTQLTGSIVELFLFENIIVTSGSFAFGYADTKTESNDFKEFRFNVLWDSKTDWKISFRQRAKKLTAQVGNSIGVEEKGTSFGNGVLAKEVNSTNYSFDLQNNGMEDVELLQCQIIGVL